MLRLTIPARLFLSSPLAALEHSVTRNEAYLVNVDGGSEVVVPQQMVVSHTDFTEVTRMVLIISSSSGRLSGYRWLVWSRRPYHPFFHPSSQSSLLNSCSRGLKPSIHIASKSSLSFLLHSLSVTKTRPPTLPLPQLHSPCPCWSCGGADHQRDLDHRDASCAFRHVRDRPRRDPCAFGCWRIG